MHWKNRDQSLSWCAGSILAISALSAAANAEVILNADSEYGSETLTIDVTHGLEFLDVTLTTNISCDDMISTHLVSGGTYEGWRHATDSELDSLIESAGISVVAGTPYLTPLFSVRALRDSLGETTIGFDGGGLFYTQGFIESDHGVNGVYKSFGTLKDPNFPDGLAGILSGGVFESGTSYWHTGHFLVRAVPTPGTLAFAGVFGVLCTRRRR